MLFNRNVLIGSAIIAGVVVLAKAMSKNGTEAGILRGVVKGMMKTVMAASDKVVEGAASLKENLEDLAAEARAEMQTDSQAQAVEAEVVQNANVQ
jgi:hypothetical protein